MRRKTRAVRWGKWRRAASWQGWGASNSVRFSGLTSMGSDPRHATAAAIDWRGTPRGFAPRPAFRSAELGPWDPNPAGPAPLRSPGADRPTDFRGLSAPTWPAVPTARPPRWEFINRRAARPSAE